MDVTLDGFVLSRDAANVLAMFILGGGSCFFGLLPACILSRNRNRYPFVMSLLLCFGAGVLLATSVVHMLPDAREGKFSNYSEIIFCAGFFIVYAIDELVHYIIGEVSNARLNTRQQQHDRDDLEHPSLLQNEERQVNGIDYGTIRGESNNLVSETDALIVPPPTLNCPDQEVNSSVCLISHIEPLESSRVGTFGLLCALCIHSLLEALAIGVQPTSNKVFLLMGAVSCHKFVVAFCLGIELSSDSLSTIRKHTISILTFAFGTILGIGIGMALTYSPESLEVTTTIPVLQGLAGGTLLYVTVSEVMPRERVRWHRNGSKSAGIQQFIASGLGFIIMTIINIYFDD